jgi:hypothetical protein
MFTIINFIILFFIILIIYQIILAYNNTIIEGLDNYQQYDTNNPQNAMILAQQNAGNIQVLKQQMDGITGLNKQVQDISGNVVTLQGQVAQLMAAQKQYANTITQTPPPSVSGLS